MVLKTNIISTLKGIEGIDYSRNDKIIIADNLKKMTNGIFHFMKAKKKKFKNYKNTAIEKYSMKNNTLKLYCKIKKFNTFF